MGSARLVRICGAPGLTYDNGSDATGTALAGAPTDAGTYTVARGLRRQREHEPASATATITIEKADSTSAGDLVR